MKCPRPACSAAPGMPSACGSSNLPACTPVPGAPEVPMSAVPLPDTLCDLNGELLPVSQAKVSVLDRGFIFGDGVYEVVPVYGRRLFRFDEHMARLTRSLSKLRIDNPASRDEWLRRCRSLVGATFDNTGAEQQIVYIQVTRGVAPREHTMPPGLQPTVFMMANPMNAVSAEMRHQGVACTTARDFRWE